MSDTDTILNTEVVIYAYTTNDNEPGTIILNTSVNPKLTDIFDNNILFTMHDVNKKTIRLEELFVNGIISVGSTDLMETLKICYPDPRINKNKPKITGRYMHGSRRRLIAKPLNVEFELDPASEPECEYNNPECEHINDPECEYNNDLAWLCSIDNSQHSQNVN
jgi:hypothetical protein